MLLTILGIIGALVLLILALYKFYNDGNQDYWKKKGVTCLGKEEQASLWETMTLKHNFIELDLKAYKALRDHRFGGYVAFRKPFFYVTDLELAKHIMVKDFDHFVDRRNFFPSNEHDKVLSKMLISRTGKEWKSLRSVMSPIFTTGKIKRMFEYFNICGHRFAAYLEGISKTKNEVEFQDAIGRYTVSVIASIVFGMDNLDVFTNEESYFRKMIVKMQSPNILRFLKALVAIVIPPIAKIFRLRLSEPKSTEFFAGIIKKSMEGRRANRGKENRQDFLQMLLEVQEGQHGKEEDTKDLDQFEKDAVLTTSGAAKKENADLDDDSIISQAFLFFFAGLDTVQNALTLAIYELALNPEVQEKLAEEIIPVMEENNGNLTYEATHRLAYLDMVVSESLRKHPPSVVTERQCTVDYKVPGTDLILPKGSVVQIPINGIHQDERYYPNPGKFNPENFSAENKANRHPYAYLPFGQGPRNCIAMRFAITEVKAALAHLIYKFKIEPCEKTTIPLKRSRTTLKPEGMWLKFQARVPEN